jgi:hypothetical protein
MICEKERGTVCGEEAHICTVFVNEGNNERCV